MKIQKLLLPTLVLVGLVIFTAENWSPAVPLILFGVKTGALPLSLWVIVAGLMGVLTTLVIAFCLRLLSNDDDRLPKRSSSQTSRPPHSPRPRPPRQPDRRSNDEPLEMEDWEEFSRPREDWEDWRKSRSVVKEVAADQPIASGSRFGTIFENKASDAHSADSDVSAHPQVAEEYVTPQDDVGRYGRDGQDGYVSNKYASSNNEGIGLDTAQAYEAYDDREYERDRNDYDRNYRSQSDYDTDDYRSARYSQSRYDTSGDNRDNYFEADDRGDRYEQDRYDRDRYEQDRYNQAPYDPDVYENSPYDQSPYDQGRYRSGYQDTYQDSYQDDYGQTPYESDGSYDRGSSSYAYDSSSDGQSNQPSSEQYIMDYGDEAALDAFDAELDARSKSSKNASQTKADSGAEQTSRGGRYRWKNPFNTQAKRNRDVVSDDLDLSSLDDWDE
ncbi:MAG: hypothetical protein AAGD25_12325 [Cyanobacteria bacterium P01_F01_bin.150]